MTDLFEDHDETPAIDPNKDYSSELVGEGKKYKDAAALARAVLEKDAFIEKLKGETSGLRQELNTRLKLEEVIDRLPKPAVAPSPSSEPQPRASEQDEDKSAITPEAIQAMVAKTLTEKEKANQRETNMAFVERKLQEAFGPAFRRTVKEQAQKLGIGEEFAKSLAAEQPQAFLKLFDVKPQPESNSTAQTPPHSSIGDAFGFRPDTGVKRRSHYEAIRKKSPAEYWSVRVQNEMHREAQKQGESFFD